MQERMVSVLEHRVRELRENIPVETELKWQCDTRDIEASISVSEILQEPVGLPNYQTFHLPTFATGKEGSVPGELSWSSH